MISTRPYLIRAIYDWIVDNQQTPHLLVEVRNDRTQVPKQYVEEGLIVLNVSPNAVRDLELGNDLIRFSARFGGAPHNISVPVDAVQAIYASENGQGISLVEPGTGVEQVDSPENSDGTKMAGNEGAQDAKLKPQRHGTPNLTIVK